MSDLIDGYLVWMRAAGMSERTIEDRAGMLRRADHDLPCGLEQASTEELAAWLGNRCWAAGTRSTYYRSLKGFFGWGTGGGYLDWNPADDLRAPRAPRGRPRPVSTDVLGDVLTRARDPFRLCVILAAYAGLRCVEIAGLWREDVTETRVLIRKAKGGNTESVPTHPFVWQAVQSFPSGSLITSAGGVATANWVSIRSAVYFRRTLGLPGVALHRFRHKFATDLRQSGRDLFVVQRLLRHQSITSTQIYADVADGECDLAVATLPVPAGHLQAA